MVPKILLVDDVNMFLELQQAYLKLSSVRVITARDGVDALKTVKKERPSLVFMDLHMPNMDGAECCARLKADPEFSALPIIMITSEGKSDDRELCIRSGCDDFLTKPLDRHKFLQTARRHLPVIDRRDLRVPCRTKAKFKVYGLTLTGEIIDVAANGVYLATEYEVEMGTRLEVLFSLPDDHGSEIRAEGKVAWLNSVESQKKNRLPAGFGVELTVLSEESRERLKLFVERHA